LPRSRAGPPGTGHEAAPEGEGRLRTRRQGGVRAPHGGPPDDHDPGAPLVRPITATLFGTVALGAAVFVSAQTPPAPNAPYAPFKIGEGLYYDGAADYAAYLIVTKAGLIQIDGGDKATGHQIVGNIRTLGFDPANIKVLLNTHQHFDHAAGLAELKRTAPGAKFYASAADGAVVAAGGKGDPFLKGARYEYEPVKPDVTL